MSVTRDRATTVAGVGAAACAACCAGPILGFLAALGLGSVLSVFVFGAIGLVATAIVGALWSRRRARRRCAPAVAIVAAPTVRTPT